MRHEKLNPPDGGDLSPMTQNVSKRTVPNDTKQERYKTGIDKGGGKGKLAVKALKERVSGSLLTETRRKVRAAGRVRSLSLRSRKEESESK